MKIIALSSNKTNAKPLPGLQWALHALLLLTLLFNGNIQTTQAASHGVEDEPENAVLVMDIHKGGGNSTPSRFTSIGSTLFFRADDGNSGVEVWKSVPPYDAAHTSRVTDINPGPGASWPESLTPIGDVLIFSADDGVHGRELWKVEPPYTSASIVQDLRTGSDGSAPDNLKALGNAVFFQADTDNGIELWKTSPPYNSAELVADIWSGGGSSNPRNLTTIGWILFFSADDSSGRELWKSEPPYNQSSTSMVKDIYPGGSSNPDELLVVGTTLFFGAEDDESGRELWLSRAPYDDERTIRANDIDHLFPSNPTNIMNIGETVFYSANVGFSGYELRKVVPPYTSTNMSRVEDANKGTSGGFPNSSFPDDNTAAGSNLFFTASTNQYGRELWHADPDYTKATLVLDINKGATSSNPQDLTAVGTTMYFTADDGEWGRELYRSVPPYDDLSSGRVTDIARGSGDPKIAELYVIGRTIFFRANNGETGAELWKIDGDSTLLPDSGFEPGVISAVGKQPAWVKYNQADGMRLRIPSLFVDVPLVGVPVADRGWELNWLGKQAGYLAGTAFPTLPGNTGIAAHAYLPDGTPGPFVALNQLKWGDRILIAAWGSQYQYEVREILKVSPDDTSVLKHEELDWITLITCEGYDETLDEYRWRHVVRAVLVEIK